MFTLIFWITGLLMAADGQWDGLAGATAITAVFLALGTPWLVRSRSVPWIPGAAIEVPVVPTTPDPWSKVGIPPRAATVDAPDHTPERHVRKDGSEPD